jgi:GAF domain-containing protein
MSDKKALFQNVLSRAEAIMHNTGNRDAKLQAICDLLHQQVDYYDWVGFYVVDDKGQELLLGPFVGKPTEHVRIPFGRGICGQAAERKQTFMVQDVSQEANYLSCSPSVRSELVVPVLKEGRVLGELDIDSQCLSPFDVEDARLLERICEMAAKLLWHVV